MFEELLNHLQDSILLHGGKQIDLESNLKECCSKKRDSTIRNWLWNVPGFRRWRVTRMDAGSKLQVLNSVAYPEYINDQPIFGVDLLWFEVKQRLVAVLDFQPLIQDEDYLLTYFQDLKLLKKKYKQFDSKEKMHIYDSNRYFSPWVLIYNGKFDNLPLSEVFIKFLTIYWEINMNNTSKHLRLNTSEVKRLQSEYDIYNAERDPAHGLFKSYYGKDWADKFVYKFLFPKSGK